MTAQISVSAILITLNEESNIYNCLNSLRWIDEVIMVDSGSKDLTLSIAKEFANTKIFNSEWLGFSETKKLAVSYTKNDWVLWIDADEIVTSELKNEILNFSPENFHAYDLPRKTFFMGEWVKYTGWYPGRVTRLFNKQFCNFNNRILHEGINCNEERLGHLKSDLEHYSYQTLFQYFNKMNAYGADGAKACIQKGKKFNIFILIISPLATFVKFYFFKLGFLDGMKGLIISVGSAYSVFIKYVNLYYLEEGYKK